MILKIYSKTMALVKKIEMDDTVIPRTGETVWFDVDGSGPLTHIVHNVEYNVVGHKLVPEVSCHSAEPSAHRKMVLEEHGWI